MYPPFFIYTYILLNQLFCINYNSSYIACYTSKLLGHCHTNDAMFTK